MIVLVARLWLELLYALLMVCTAERCQGKCQLQQGQFGVGSPSSQDLAISHEIKRQRSGGYHAVQYELSSQQRQVKDRDKDMASSIKRAFVLLLPFPLLLVRDA